MNTQKAFLGSAIVFYFIIGLEVLIMISPFAGFFYSIFNPFLLEIAGHWATSWLCAFFLPHMTLPSDGLLRFIRVMGSVTFIAGVCAFLVCAIEVYASKGMKRGTVVRGLYRYIRHPQYVALAVAGVGLSILWPRFLSVFLWLVMILAYYFLARDEERRMIKAHGQGYGKYLERTGMFLPKVVENALHLRNAPSKGVFFIFIVVMTIGGGFFLRAYTIDHLTTWKNDNLLALAILPQDSTMLEHRMPDILKLSEVTSRLNAKGDYLVYLMPRHYIMQGMIADTGEDWKLYKKHHTLGMITDWILHPDSHLSDSHHHGHDLSMQQGDDAEKSPFTRRLIFLKLFGRSGSGIRDIKPFSIDTQRIPYFMLDINVHTLSQVSVKDLEPTTGWGRVPTPMF
ncbi:MAG: isoprenylcysteine carboxylmethyltransferase family protein [Nitrospirae bacterium]|nr:isoprenylcysteine carboxylmethyltransferase family protein [Nitrospirota bacterium]